MVRKKMSGYIFCLTLLTDGSGIAGVNQRSSLSSLSDWYSSSGSVSNSSYFDLSLGTFNIFFFVIVGK